MWDDLKLGKDLEQDFPCPKSLEHFRPILYKPIGIYSRAKVYLRNDGVNQVEWSGHDWQSREC